MPIAADLALSQPPHAIVIAATTTWKSIVVQPGDTIWQLALHHHSTVEALVARNRLAHGGAVIFPGQRLLVPGTTATARAAAGSSEARAGAGTRHAGTKHVGTRYTVRPGDTLFGIAAAHRVSLGRLLSANLDVTPGLIFPGQRIIIPGARPATRPAAAPTATSENTFAGRTYPDATVAAARANRAALAKRPVPNRTATAALIRQTATRHGVDPRLALAIAWQESGWQQRVVSVGNAIGTMQVIPASGRWASDLAGRRLDLLDTADNITAGVVIIKSLMRVAKDRDEAIAGYYQGLRSVRSNGLYRDTKGYVAAVLAHYQRM